MNITPQASFLPIQTVVNLPTDSLRRDNNLREVIVQPAAVAAEKGVSAEKERPLQNNEQFNFTELRKKAEENATVISNSSEQGQGSSEGSERGSPTDPGQDEERAESNQPEKNSIQAFAETKEIKQLQQRDREVRSHELAHAAVGGASTGAPSYTFQTGPDGKKYAVGGEVSVDLSTIEGKPRATIAKMQKVHAAALAPAHPSIQDTRVAATATKLILQAQAELASIQLEDPNNVDELAFFIKPTDIFEQGQDKSKPNSFFNADTKINQSLESEDITLPSRPINIDQRALRIEGFYSTITQAYEKPASHQFQLTA